MNDFVEVVFEFVRKFKMTENFTSVAVALSGGADSVSLLCALSESADSLGITLCACHLNHGLRGAESDRDEEFCKLLCEKMQIPIYTNRIDVKTLQNKHEGIENAARRARYAFFREIHERVGGVIATAHTASDNAETVLLNLTRGTGLRGLCGIPPQREFIIRPLLNVTREDVERYLDSLGQDFVTDCTNLSEDYTRNKIRLNVIPQLEEINPAFSKAVTRMCESAREDCEFLEELAEHALADAKSGRGYDAAKIHVLPEAVKSRAVKKILEDGGIEPSALRINTAKELLNQRSARFNPCKNRYFTIRKGIAFVEQVEQKINHR
ncbi:MAG: tRNA lysidine(34) synthetase TilS [Ruminococcaceae bacterium]|nr:tRNA lysidine(34) synthetase TilS [Oscillospiraceae bacterium]